MSTVDSPAPPAARPLAWWLVPTGVLALVSIGILWALPRPLQACPAIYPAPPECFAGADYPSAVIPFLVLIVFAYAAIVACAVLVPPRRRPLVLGLLSGAIGLLLLVGVAATLNAANGPVVVY